MMPPIVCAICGERAEHTCHVKDKSTFEQHEDHLYRNHIFLCQTHHLQYFDVTSGRKGRPSYLLICLISNELWLVRTDNKKPKEEHIEKYTYPENFDLDEDYVNWKNKKAIVTLRTALRKFQIEQLA